jgi:hypothetical protein
MFTPSAQHAASDYAGTFSAAIPLRPPLEGRLDCEVLIMRTWPATPLEAAGKAWYRLRDVI